MPVPSTETTVRESACVDPILSGTAPTDDHLVGDHPSRRPDHRNTGVSPGVGNHHTAPDRTVITLGLAIAIGLPLAVLILAVTLPEHRDKRGTTRVPRGRARPPDTPDDRPSP